jgi:hypothetical protein
MGALQRKAHSANRGIPSLCRIKGRELILLSYILRRNVLGPCQQSPNLDSPVWQAWFGYFPQPANLRGVREGGFIQQQPSDGLPGRNARKRISAMTKSDAICFRDTTDVNKQVRRPMHASL